MRGLFAAVLFCGMVQSGIAATPGIITCRVWRNPTWSDDAKGAYFLGVLAGLATGGSEDKTTEEIRAWLAKSKYTRIGDASAVELAAQADRYCQDPANSPLAIVDLLEPISMRIRGESEAKIEERLAELRRIQFAISQQK